MGYASQGADRIANCPPSAGARGGTCSLLHRRSSLQSQDPHAYESLSSPAQPGTATPSFHLFHRLILPKLLVLLPIVHTEPEDARHNVETKCHFL